MGKPKVRLDFQAATDGLAFLPFSFKRNITHSPAGSLATVNSHNSNDLLGCSAFYLEASEDSTDIN